MFDWLKTTIGGQGKKKPAAAKTSLNHITIDSRSYPLVGLTAKGFVAGDYDTTVAAGQNASIAVTVSDRWGKFSFATRCSITATDSKHAQFAGSFMLLAPEVEQVLIQYARNKGASQPPKRG